MKRKQSILILLFLLVLAVSTVSCTSQSREELNMKLEEGEVLLSQEKYDEAVIFFEDLLEKNQDSISIMEKLEYARTMSHSRQHLSLAEQFMQEDRYEEAYESLAEIDEEDEKGLDRKDEIITEIREIYVDRARNLSEARLFRTAIKTLNEYLLFAEEDAAVDELKAVILKESQKPVEPVVVKKIIVINPGHQAVPDSDKEPLGPGSTELKNRVTLGTRGVSSGVYEYELNLEVSLKLRDRLVEEGYEVIMTRTAHDVSISNRERVEMANDAGADLYLSIHANGSENPEKVGVMTIYPSAENPFVAELSGESLRLSQHLHDEMIRATGAESDGVRAMDNMVSLNWSKVPASIVELGYMTNEEEDLLMGTEEYQDKLIQGMINGISRFLEDMNP
ncbi:MAG TPA: N-acetylmuramoyl-L-alanine amidase, partial [Bacteroidales bacterium]|nr:N-acetylmuramoyl-L-alanine amidase [Bacteroidales bacterium]